MPWAVKWAASLPVVVVLPVPLTPTIMMTSGAVAGWVIGAGDAVEDGLELELEQALEFGAALDAVAEGALAQVLDDLRGGGGADVGGEQDGVEVGERGVSISRVRAMTEPMDSERVSRVRVTACFMRSKKPSLASGTGAGSGSGTVGVSGSGARLPKKEKAMSGSSLADGRSIDGISMVGKRGAWRWRLRRWFPWRSICGPVTGRIGTGSMARCGSGIWEKGNMQVSRSS